MNLMDISGYGLMIAFVFYTFSFFFFVISLVGKRWSNRDPELHVKRWSKSALFLTFIGLIAQLTYLITRWVSAGHIPVTNMFEFLTFLSMMIIVAFIIVYFIYRIAVLGVFATPVGIVIMAYASVFPQETQPLVPSLQKFWLYIHVTTAATAEAFLAVGFAAGLMYLLRTVDFQAATKAARKSQRGIEITLFTILILIGFIIMGFVFKGMDYQATFTHEVVTKDGGTNVTTTEDIHYTFPPVIAPNNSQLKEMEPFLGLKSPVIEAPYWMQGINSGRKLNTLFWSVIAGLLLYGLLRLLVRKPLGAALQPVLDGIDPEDLDEISYRSIAIGYPIFILGALIFAMIWASQAWGRFWAFDPKETWALITFLFYTWYLHLRLSKGWHGSKSSWLAVIGFLIVLFTLIGVNLVLAGLHSYAEIK